MIQLRGFRSFVGMEHYVTSRIASIGINIVFVCYCFHNCEVKLSGKTRKTGLAER